MLRKEGPRVGKEIIRQNFKKFDTKFTKISRKREFN